MSKTLKDYDARIRSLEEKGMPKGIVDLLKQLDYFVADSTAQYESIVELFVLKDMENFDHHNDFKDRIDQLEALIITMWNTFMVQYEPFTAIPMPLHYHKYIPPKLSHKSKPLRTYIRKHLKAWKVFMTKENTKHAKTDQTD